MVAPALNSLLRHLASDVHAAVLHPATEIVIATHPPGQSHWLERGPIEKARARFGLAVVHVVSSYGLAEEAVAA